jgi:hypothetical protein
MRLRSSVCIFPHENQRLDYHRFGVDALSCEKLLSLVLAASCALQAVPRVGAIRSELETSRALRALRS